MTTNLPRIGPHIQSGRTFGGIDGAALFDEIYTFIGLYVIYPNEHMQAAHTLWIVHTHLMEFWDSTPRIHFKSPEPGSGKSRAFEVSEHLVHRGFIALNMSPAYLIRKLGDKPENRPTLLVDEIDTMFGPKAKEHEEIRGVINAGHRRTGVSGRCVVNGNQVDTIEFPAYGAVGLAGLHDLPETIRSRAVVVSMKKRNKDTEKVKPWRIREDEPKAKALGLRIAEWATAVKQELWDGNKFAFDWPEMPEGVEDRAADVWEALLVCANLAGGAWPLTCGNAALAALAADRGDGEPSDGVKLLADLHSIFGNELARTSIVSQEEIAKDALKTPTLLTALIGMEEASWSSFQRNGNPISARDLSQMLKCYGIKSQNIWWTNESNSKGYYRKDFEDAWTRYVFNVEEETESASMQPSTNGHKPVSNPKLVPTAEF